MTVTLGINPITWTNDDVPDSAATSRSRPASAETREAGYAGTEMGGKFPRDRRRARADPRRHHLKLVSGWYDGRMFENAVEQEFAAVLPHLTLLRDLGARSSSTPTPRAAPRATCSSRPRAVRNSPTGNGRATARD